jgi:hypothetical protein
MFTVTYDIATGDYQTTFSAPQRRWEYVDQNGNTFDGVATASNFIPTSGNWPITTLQITTTSLPDGNIGQAYSQTVEATGGTTPYTWSWAPSSNGGTTIPPDLSIDLSSGTISRTPSQTGTFPVTITVTDSNGLTASVELQTTITGSCPTSVVIHTAYDPPSRDLFPTRMIGFFSPVASDGTPISLDEAAAACGYIGFDWQQTIVSWPPPTIPSKCSQTPSPCLVSASGQVLSIPPLSSFPDPPKGGYLYTAFPNANNPFFYDAYPFYYNLAVEPTTTAAVRFSSLTHRVIHCC